MIGPAKQDPLKTNQAPTELIQQEPITPEIVATPPARVDSPVQPAVPPAQNVTQPQMGPLDRMMDPFMRKALTTLSPAKYREGIVNNYIRNRTAWNLGAAALGGLGLAAAVRGIRNAFGSDDDDDDDYYVPRRRRRSRGLFGLGGWGNALTFLAPMALLAGGGYLWNKYGDKVRGTFSTLGNIQRDYEKYKPMLENGLKDYEKYKPMIEQGIKDYNEKYKPMLDRMAAAEQGLQKTPVIGWAYKKLRQK